MSMIEPTRMKESYAHVWPGCPKGLTLEQARKWFEQKKPRSYMIERIMYNPKTGYFATYGCDV